MNIVVVDTNGARQKKLGTMLKAMYSPENVMMFSDTNAALRYVQKCPVDAVFAECDMQPMDGIVFRDRVHKSRSNLRVIITDDNDYEELMPSDIILIRPITPEKIKECMTR